MRYPNDMYREQTIIAAERLKEVISRTQSKEEEKRMKGKKAHGVGEDVSFLNTIINGQ